MGSIRRILGNFLYRRGEVREAVRDKEIAEESLRRIEDHLAQLALLDIGMPLVNGLDP